MAEHLTSESIDKAPKYRQLGSGENIDFEKRERHTIILEVGCGSKPYFINQEEVLKENEHYIGIDLPQQYIGEQINLRPITTKERKDKIDYSTQLSWFELKKIEKEIADHQNLIKGKIDLLIASGLNLPLRDESANKVVFSAVFGAPSQFFDSINFCSDKKEFNKILSRPFVQNYIKNFSDPKRLEDGERFVIGALREGSPMKFSDIFLDSYKSYEFDMLSTRYAKENLLNEAYRILKDNGNLIIYDNDKEFNSEYGLGEVGLTKMFEIIGKEYLKKEYTGADHFKLSAKKKAI